MSDIECWLCEMDFFMCLFSWLDGVRVCVCVFDFAYTHAHAHKVRVFKRINVRISFLDHHVIIKCWTLFCLICKFFFIEFFVSFLLHRAVRWAALAAVAAIISWLAMWVWSLRSQIFGSRREIDCIDFFLSRYIYLEKERKKDGKKWYKTYYNMSVIR